jgi:hypothetical protein
MVSSEQTKVTDFCGRHLRLFAFKILQFIQILLTHVTATNVHYRSVTTSCSGPLVLVIKRETEYKTCAVTAMSFWDS